MKYDQKLPKEVEDKLDAYITDGCNDCHNPNCECHYTPKSVEDVVREFEDSFAAKLLTKSQLNRHKIELRYSVSSLLTTIIGEIEESKREVGISVKSSWAIRKKRIKKNAKNLAHDEDIALIRQRLEV